VTAIGDGDGDGDGGPYVDFAVTVVNQADTPVITGTASARVDP
jgi:hypothetical protein